MSKEVLSEGTGVTPQEGHTVFAHYTGTLENGEVFDSSRGKPHRAEHGFYFTLGAGEVIRGWDVGLASMRVGEKARLKLAPEYAYGENGAPGTIIGKNATLIFEMELLDSRVITPAERRAIDDKVASLRR